jgi:AcrR family transcriptional regulator
VRPPNPDNQRRQIAKILDHARRLFARHGYDRVSMDKIAAACHVTKPTLYYYFKNKRAVLLAVLHARWVEQAALLRAFRPAGSLKGTLHVLAELILSETENLKNSDIIRIVLAEAGRQPDLGKAFFKAFGPFFEGDLVAAIRPLLHRRYSDRMVAMLFHQFIGSLAHYSLMRQVFRAEAPYLPGRRPYVDLLVDSFLRSTSPSSSELPSDR